MIRKTYITKVLLLSALFLILLLSGCSRKPEIVNTIDNGFKTYHEMSDGTWQTDGRTYSYRLEVSGRMHNAVKDSTFVYLSNLEEISFGQAWKAAGLSSSSDDYFALEDAVLVDIKYNGYYL